MTKALLLLTGGRGVTDMLVVKYLRPDVVFNLTTTVGLKDAAKLQKLVQAEYGCKMEILSPIDPYSEQEIKRACSDILQKRPDAEWIIHFTSSPKIVGIYAHDVAREHDIPYWFLDTGGKKVISLVKEIPVDTEQLFQAYVEEYMGAYGRTYEIPKSLTYRKKAESWYPLAKMLAHNAEATQLLLNGVRSTTSLDIAVDKQTEQLIRQLSTHDPDFLTIRESTTDKLQCTISSNDIRDFLLGDWLEVYVWQEAIRAKFANDCHWGYKIVADLPSNELDVVLTYNARLLIAECKTRNSKRPFDTDDLYKLHSIADLVGGNYVRQIFVNSHPRPATKNESFDNFCQQADLRHIRVVTGEQLPDIGNILRQEMGVEKSRLLPTYGDR